MLITNRRLLCCAFLAFSFSPVVFATTGDVWREATLYRDEWGTPHVYAENPFALAFVFGYAQAEDHAEHMLLAYRMANGRLAAVLGEPFADSDAFSLKMGHARLAEAALAEADPVTLALCEGFAMGVNAWLVDHANEMPAWADGVQPQDILAFWHAFVMSMAPYELPEGFRRPPAMTTGNAWATTPERSAEGKATLVINPHQQHDGFFQWYEAHLIMGDMKIYGATLRGLPVIVQGHNEALGWALTPNQSNFADMYIEEYEAPAANPKDPRVRPDDGGAQHALLLHYMAHSLPYHVRTDAGLETRHVPAYIGERGPLFEHSAHGLTSWFIGGYTDFGGLRQLVEMARAQSLDAFWAALNMQQIPCFHVVYADRQGNIFYLYNTKAGVRLAPASNEAAGFDTSLVNHDWDAPITHRVAAVAWREVFAPHDLPSLLNPESGFIQACGNPPWTVAEPFALDPELWPHWLARDHDSYRARRARQLLRQGPRSFRDHQSMLFDVVVPAALDMTPVLMRVAETRPEMTSVAHPDFHAGLKLLREWNFIAETSAPGMTFYHVWWTFVRTRAMEAFPTEQAFYAAARDGASVAQDIMLRSVEDAARTLKNEYGTLEVPWGEAHRIRRGQRDEPMAGAHSGEPLFVASDYVFDRGRWITTYGYGFAMATQFGDYPESVSLMPFGASLRPDSPHYDDQLDLMLERRFKRVRFHDDEVLRHADRAMGKCITLLPLGVPGAITLHAPGIIHARMHTDTEAPDALPHDMIPFSLYMRPERAPAGAPVMAELSVHIPPELCDDNGFDAIRLYRYEPGLDWQPVDFQQSDARTRIVYARDEVLAQWYAALGPADAAGPERYQLDEREPETDAHSEALVGLDALLSEHAPQRAVTNERRRFHLERHDAEETPENAPEIKAPGRTFRIERLEENVRGDTSKPRYTPLNIPGYHFGPSATGRDTHASPDADRIFRFERHDHSTAQAESDQETPPDELPARTHEPAPTEIPAPQQVEAPMESPVALPPAPTSSGEAPPSTQAEESAPRQAPDDSARERRPRPPLPDVIPQDPAFVFGPSQRPQERQGASGDRVFHIERHE